MTKSAEWVWEDVGRKMVKVQRGKVLVKTKPHSDMATEHIFLPGSKHGFYGGMGKERLVIGEIIAKACDVTSVELGDSVLFERLMFARYEKLSDGTYAGWVFEKNLLGHVNPEAHVRRDYHRHNPDQNEV